MASITPSSSSQRRITSTTADNRADVSCEFTSRGGVTSTRQSTATTTMASEERSKRILKKTIVAQSDATATMAGMMAWNSAITAIEKLCLSKTGWLISIQGSTHVARQSHPA